MSTGLSGTPMPSFSDTQSEEDRWALSYYVLSLSAFTDPLTGEKMQISEADRAALNDPAMKATESQLRVQVEVTDAGEADLLRGRSLGDEARLRFRAAAGGGYRTATRFRVEEGHHGRADIHSIPGGDLLMSLGAVCVFVWAVLSGMFNDVEEIKYKAYRAEVNDDE